MDEPTLEEGEWEDDGMTAETLRKRGTRKIGLGIALSGGAAGLGALGVPLLVVGIQDETEWYGPLVLALGVPVTITASVLLTVGIVLIVSGAMDRAESKRMALIEPRMRYARAERNRGALGWRFAAGPALR